MHRAITACGEQDPLSVEFVADRYGPYADRLRHLLNALDGSYLHCARRLSEAGPLEPIYFDEEKRAAVAAYLSSDEARRYVPALDAATAVIDGFESPLGMELLATVDWLLQEEDCEPTVAALRRCLSEWPGGSDAADRKLRLFDDRLLELALDRLKQPLVCESLRLC
jgi:hypothetical protein